MAVFEILVGFLAGVALLVAYAIYRSVLRRGPRPWAIGTSPLALEELRRLIHYHAGTATLPTSF